MNKFSNDRYAKTFERLKKERRIGFCPFAVLGDPTPKECLVRIKKYLEVRPDFLELGIPFSDPIADGPVIQAADERALASGMTLKKAIELVKRIRALIQQSKRDIPIGILTYSNIILRYGVQKFYSDLKKSGTDSVLIADVPLEEIAPFAKAAKAAKIHQIFLVSEHTLDIPLKNKVAPLRRGGDCLASLRLGLIEKIATGFLYAVSVLGITGARKELNKSTLNFVRRLKTKTRLPIMVGFGISTREHIKALQNVGADGAIIGSALVKTPISKLPHFLKNLRG